ncbi:DinB family protein [Polymorphum gilvum]|uniref:DinB family protein n=1 Tax=Polymorphum gilvum (strain LMG 25793 / CGMCC 1.9160 / SL003B-26A1) TaxID=991905 RepID=F2J1L2_POLGS|nr:DinB family protein [Polymorphum gilvum]ADZ70813.1 DinB family protein [Polymorphum gilvum SL003B-26A1]
MKAYMRMMAGYNHWANTRLLEDCTGLSDEEYHRNLAAYYRSIHGTLDHLLLADMIWLVRLYGEGEAFDTFDMTLTEDLASLKAERDILDARLIAYIDQVTEGELLQPIRYRTILNPVVIQQPIGAALVHVFNHQTHHRGQVHAFLTMLGRKPRALDLIHFQRESGLGMAA